MPREQISVDIPDEWNENMKHGRCWCGKNHTQFDKGQKFYCSLSHSKEYSKRIKYWSTFRDEILDECGRKCSECNHTKETFEKIQEDDKKNTLRIESAKYPEAIKAGRAQMLIELQEKFEKIKDDVYVLENMSYKIIDTYSIPRFYDFFKKKWFQLEVDHIVAIALGGEMWDKKNLRVLCSDCHKVKTKDDMKKLRVKRKQEKNQTLDPTLSNPGDNP